MLSEYPMLSRGKIHLSSCIMLCGVQLKHFQVPADFKDKKSLLCATVICVVIAGRLTLDAEEVQSASGCVAAAVRPRPPLHGWRSVPLGMDPLPLVSVKSFSPDIWSQIAQIRHICGRFSLKDMEAGS